MNRFFKILLIAVGSLYLLNASIAKADDKSAVFAVVQQFQKALQTGESAQAIKLLAKDVLIMEGGEVERSAKEYQNHHLSADIAFLKEMKVTVLEQKIWLEDNQAVVSSLTQTEGSFRGRPYNKKGTETLLLKKINKQWKVIYIHWS